MSGYPPGPPPGPPGGFPPFPPPALPPLAPGWTEHIAPDGITRYYYNAATKQSTYTRPVAVPVPGQIPPGPPPPPPAGKPTSEEPNKNKAKDKKEKAKAKVPIGSTGWTRVTTSQGNTFYFHKESKRSEWTVPEEIADQVKALDEQAERAKQAAEEEEKAKAEQERLERLRERERIRAEILEERKRKAAEEEGDAPAKRAKKIEEPEEQYAPDGEEDEEAWQRAVAAEFAEADLKAKEEEAEAKERVKETEAEAAKKVFAVPQQVNVSLEEQRALFKALLLEKDISPFAPWDQSLPLFINDPRYVLLSSEKDRREVYEEYCRDVGRARRLNKGSAAKAAAEKKADPEREYRALMRDQVKSTRTRWDDFRRQWKKDRRFYSFGRDDREREKAFKVHLRELGERKRADAQRAEADFFELLAEAEAESDSTVWAEFKKGIAKDPRYDAVGSSSLRQELFETFIKNKAAEAARASLNGETLGQRRAREKREKAEASLREREAKVREEKERVSKEVGRSRAGAGKEEGERLFESLLVDKVHDPELSFDQASRFLSSDSRFRHPSLAPFDKQRLFVDHIARLGSKRSNALHQLFASHAPELDTPFDAVYAAIADDPVVKRLDLLPSALQDRFAAWTRQRETDARKAFDEMLGENSFVEFWGSMRKKQIEERKEKKEGEGEREGGGEEDEETIGDGAAADLAAMARKIDLDEIKSVLRRDKRYRIYDHIPETREQWLRDYLENLSAASGSKTIHHTR